ncbi:nucleotidyltransferase domain-containing protein [Denitromonas iodatirespirans]|uniref:Nucleotidyltransferase family protein n=1 Tax=Denitromonas iodatirespirans TaxID=2795389 RepID=A0A944DE99_DENI1|nr:nucleotidyltransferase family protein [Denitromonas iodatirespirans]MBT0963927.1 nucleotidyltransferase family protein [Denitromonas iodatirespirans]
MRAESASLLADTLTAPEPRLPRSATGWDLLIRHARHANLLARLHHRIAELGALSSVPEAPRRHLIAAHHLAHRQHQAVRHETDELRRALQPEGIDVILLKGAAYVVAGLPAAAGRVFSDIDILVPKPQLPQAESALMRHGWMSAKLTDYDQRYYRRWMHELPPMQHMFRGSALDVHHTILPPTARYHPDPTSLVSDSIAVPNWPGVRVLSPCDMILHSATHLFHEGEADNALRDLSDLDLLLRHFSREAGDGFWQQLVARAAHQHLGYPLWLALRYTGKVFGTPMPSQLMPSLPAVAPGGARLAMLDAIYSRILRPQHPTCADAFSALACKALYIRGHWLRMPPHLLALHLARKAITPEEKPSTDQADENERAA